MINKKIRSPFKKRFGKELHEEQKVDINYRDGSLKQSKRKRGRI